MNLKNSKQEIYQAYKELKKELEDSKHLQSQIEMDNEKFLERYGELRFIVERVYLEQLPAIHHKLMRDSAKEIEGYNRNLNRWRGMYLIERGFDKDQVRIFYSPRIGEELPVDLMAEINETLQGFDPEVYRSQELKARQEQSDKEIADNKAKEIRLKKVWGDDWIKHW